MTDVFADVRGSAIDYLSKKLQETERKLAEANEQLATSADFITTLRCEKEDAEAKLAEARVAIENIKGRCSDVSITLHPDADAKGCVDDCWEWSERALARIDENAPAMASADTQALTTPQNDQ